ncbi:FtsX-like permease family protein [Clostridium sp. CS001]|uniref:ABC transporter permease n=1 Tax=Clostridium sp. CS001 TaxID=2880648 RepID=UPI001CF22448|nr:FtsX-like permease family protein [Clostridium sp. CS001]MCB2289159.1 FtsX-like permease family protein [Clostridium sp. CS001]
MKKTFFKNLTRDVKETLSRFLSIVIIIAIGVAFYAGIRATSPDMKLSADTYFSENNLMDFKLISTLGLTKDDISVVEKQEGVTKVEGSYSIDAVIEKDKKMLVLNINSQPEENSINSVRMVSGRKATTDNEAVVEEKFLLQNNLKLNDKIVLKSGDDSNIQDNLNNTEFKIVGTAKSPLYISEQRQLSSVGNGSVRGFIYILPTVFKSDAYTEVYVRTKSSESESSLINNENYKKANASIEKALKDLGTSRGEIRYAGILKEGNDKLNDAEAKLNDSKKEAKEKFEEGYSKLKDASNKIDVGMLELKKSEATFNEKMADGEKQIKDGKAKIILGEAELNAKYKDIEKGKLGIAEGKIKLNNSEKDINLGKQKAASDISSSVSQKVNDSKKQMDSDPNNTMYIAEYNFLNDTYERDIKGRDFDSMYTALKSDNKIEAMQPYFDIEALKGSFDKGASDIAVGRSQLSNNEKQLQGGEAKIAAGRAELKISKEKIEDSEVQLNKGRLEGLAKIDKARKEIEDGKIEIKKNTETLKTEEEKANTKIKEGEAEIQENRDKLEDIKTPDWYVLGRSANIGYETYRQDSNRINNIGKLFPLIFFLVAALVSLTTMTRMVQEKRIEIGTFKALGYSRAAIVSHYLIYALSASLIGSLIGVSIGFRLFPPLIMKAYGSLYAIPRSLAPFNNGLALQASLIAILFTAVAAVAATLEELREEPASLMRPKPPKSGKVILLERVNFIWKRLSFTRKVTARNIFRYKQRLFMTVIGVAACTGLLVTGFGLKEGIVGSTEKQFRDIYKYDMQGTLTKNVRETEKNSIKEQIVKDTNVKSILFTYSKNATVKMDNALSHDVYVVVPEKKEALSSYINLKENDKELNLGDEGVIITKKLSKIINKKAGDTIVITLNDKDLEVKIEGITEHYVQHYIYISPSYYQKVTGSNPIFNSFYGLIENVSETYKNNTSTTLKSIKGVNSIGFKSNVHVDMNKAVDSINSVVLVLIVAAGVLAFVVIFNLTNINISERRRELATIKLLGFYNDELAKYIYRENIILTVIGSLTGIFVGIVLNSYVINSAETDVIMFLRKISPIYFVYSVLLTILFSVIVNLAMYGRFDKIDMIESLKSAE